MLYKNFMYLCLLLVLSSFRVMAPSTQKWVISANSSLAVNGTTNINKFTCDIPAYDQTDTLLVSKARNSKEIILTGTIDLKVQSFDCHNSMMTHDLRKTLKEKEYPRLHIRFLTLSELPELTTISSSMTGTVNIEIAGVIKHTEINYQVTIDAQKTIHLLGSRDVNFSDFKLTPPRKLGGMIKTNDKLNVVFHLKIKAI
jgi:hypothetical protein